MIPMNELSGKLTQPCRNLIIDKSLHMARKRKSKTSKRTIVAPAKRGKRYVRRNKQGQFKKQVSVGKSLTADRKQSAKTRVEKGQGDRGDCRSLGQRANPTIAPLRQRISSYVTIMFAAGGESARG